MLIRMVLLTALAFLGTASTSISQTPASSPEICQHWKGELEMVSFNQKALSELKVNCKEGQLVGGEFAWRSSQAMTMVWAPMVSPTYENGVLKFGYDHGPSASGGENYALKVQDGRLVGTGRVYNPRGKADVTAQYQPAGS